MPDIEAPGAFGEVVKNVDGIIHVASPFHYPVENNERDLFFPAKNGTLRVLEAAEASGNKRIERVVITSSFAAILDVPQGYRPDKVYTEADWNPISWEEAKVANGPVAYCASKVFAEKAAWEWVKQRNPTFTLSTLCPPMVFGPNTHYVSSLNALNTSSANIWGLIDGTTKDVPYTGFPAFADVRDLAEAHRRAFELQQAAGQRYIITTSAFTNQQICDIVRDEYPQLRDRVPVGNTGETLPSMYCVDNTKATEQLGLKWTPLRETVKASVDSLLQLEKKLGSQ